MGEQHDQRLFERDQREREAYKRRSENHYPERLLKRQKDKLDYYYARKIQNQDDAVYAQHDQEDLRQERMAKQMLANEARVAEEGRLATARMIKDTQFRNNLPGFVAWAQSGKDKLSDQDLTKLGVPQHLLPGYQQQLANAIRPQHSNRPGPAPRPGHAGR